MFSDAAGRDWVVLFQLPHSHYFTTRILVLKFTNKGVLFEEIKDSHFPRKGGILVLISMNLEKKGANFDVQCFTVKRVFSCSFGLKSQCFTTKKWVHFELKSRCFIAKKWLF